MTDQDPSSGARPADAPERPTRDVTRVLVAIAVAAFALRLVMIFAVHPLCDFDPDRWDDASQYFADPGLLPSIEPPSCITLQGDSAYIYIQGRMLAAGNGLSDPVIFLSSRAELPSGKKPPGVVVIVAALDRAGLGSPDAARVVLAAFGAGTVLVTGRLAARLFGRRVGVIAGALCAVNPMMVINDWRLLTESMAAFFFAGMLSATYRLWERPSSRAAAAIGLCGVGVGYARPEAPLLVAAMVPPSIALLRHLSASARWRLMLTMSIVAIAGISPLWTANMIRYDRPVPVGPGNGWGMMNSSCDVAWYYELTGYLTTECFDRSVTIEVFGTVGDQATTGLDETEADITYRAIALDYVRRNLTRAPAVAAARVGRVFGFYSPAQTIDLDQVIEERGFADSTMAFAFYYATLPFAILGGVALRRRQVPLLPLLSPFPVTVILVAGSFGLPRYRVFVDVSLMALASVGVATAPALIRQLRARRSAASAAGSGPWWSPADGPDAPAPDVTAAARRTGPPRHPIGRTGLIVLAIAAVLMSATVAWSATVEPDRSIPGVAPEAQAQLCTHLATLAGIVDQIEQNPAVATRIPATLDAVERLGPTDAKDDVAEIRRFFAQGATATTGSAAISSEATAATARLLRLKLRAC